MRFGAAYYPEYWPRERWAVDAEMMQRAHFDVVRIGEFAWRTFEPEEGQFDFELFDAAIETLGQYGIQVILCTPTASMPAWVQARHPDVNVVDAQGARRSWGSRKNWCYTNPTMCELSRNVTRAMAQHYAGHPNIVAWQTDNEMAYSGCFCQHCAEGFQAWLAERYESPQALSEAWGLKFWSMEINRWSEMLPPREVARQNPSHTLAYRRFQSDSVLRFNREQVQAIKAADPAAKVTHNYMTTYSGIDYHEMAKDLDFVANDIYPRNIELLPSWSYGLDVIRGYNGGAGYWIHELQCGYITRESQLRTPAPGMIRLWTHQVIAHGADTVCYFRWRPATGGTEQYHSGIVQHDGSDAKSRSYREIAALGQEIERLRELGVAGSEVRNQVAILRSFDQCRDLELYRGGKLLDYDEEIKRYYRGLWDANIGVDVVHPEDDLSGYELVIAPLFMLVKPDWKGILRDFVAAGGTLITSFRLGANDQDGLVPTETLPTDDLAELFGVEIHEYDCLLTDAEIDPTPRVAWRGDFYDTCVWADMLEPISAETLARYTNSWYEPYAALTMNTFGKGRAYYVGAGMEASFYARFLPEVAAECGIEGALETPEGVSAQVRWVDGRPLTYVMNMTTEKQMVALPRPMRDVLLDRDVGQALLLAPRDVVALI